MNDNSFYEVLLDELKHTIRQARLKAVLTVNVHMIKMYWDIGKSILARQKEQGWGAKVIDNLSKDLRSEFPDMKGISTRNLKYMRKFAAEYQDFTFVQHSVAQFYHFKLKCFVVLELKIDDFKPEYVGKLNFYLSIVDDLVKESRDAPTIGLLLCKTKNDVIVEYALQKLDRPMGVASYQLTKQVPDNLKDSLPTAQELQKVINGKTK